MKKSITQFLSIIMAISVLVLSLSSALPFAAGAAASASSEFSEIPLPNGDFENGNGEGWQIETDPIDITTDQWDQTNSTYSLQVPETLDGDTLFTAAYTVKLTAGEYYFTFDISGNTIDSKLGYTVVADGVQVAVGEGTYTTAGWAKWQTESTTAFTLDEPAEVTFSYTGTKAAAYWGRFDNLKLYGTGAIHDDREVLPIELPNGDFEYGDGSKWVIVTDPINISQDKWDSSNSTYTLQIPQTSDGDTLFSASYTLGLTAGTYHFTFDLSGDTINSGLHYEIKSGDEVIVSGEETYTTLGWANWQTEETAEFTLSAEAQVTFSLLGTKAAAYWGYLDNLKLYGTGSYVSPDPEPVDAGIYVPYIKGTAGDDFMRGADVSSLLSVLRSGARFKDWEGNSLGESVEEQGRAFFVLLKEAGVNWIRLRVWNDPFDADGNGYGGGNNGIEEAKIMGEWASEAGLKLLIDFHYSDFWADPGKQQVPKAWSGYTVDEKDSAIEAYTNDSLVYLLDAGVDVGMVQIGNETTNSVCGESSWANRATLFSAGSKAVRDVAELYGKDILVAIHFTNPERSGNYANFAKQLDTYGVDYDVFASSYYPYWHGTLDNLTSVLKQVADTYGKKVVVAETSWAYTLDDGDGHDNTVRVKNNDNPTYEFSVQGQATEVSSVMEAVTKVGDAGIGVFYWEAAWIPVVNVSGLSGDERTAQIDENKLLWEQYGSGWASSYAAEYDPGDAGVWYGGSAVDNQALFDFDGNPLESLNVFKYVTTGTAGFDIVIDSIETFAQTYAAGSSLSLPETANVTYNFGAPESLPIVWNEEDVSMVDMNTPGTYTIHGTVGEDGETVCVVTVNYPNLLQNPSFESSDMSMYNISQQAKRTGDDPHSGSYSLHFYNSGKVNFTVDQSVTLAPGGYTFSLYAQGGNIGDAPQTYAYVKIGDEVITEDFELTGWAIWANPVISFVLTEETTVSVGANVTATQNGAWGTLDDWYLCKTVPCTSHEGVVIEAIAPTCTEAGHTEGLICSVCGEILEEYEVTAPLGHSFGEWEVVKEATREEEGLEKRICERCGDSEERAIEKLPPLVLPLRIEPGYYANAAECSIDNENRVINIVSKKNAVEVDFRFLNSTYAYTYTENDARIKTKLTNGKFLEDGATDNPVYVRYFVAYASAGFEQTYEITVTKGGESVVYTVNVIFNYSSSVSGVEPGYYANKTLTGLDEETKTITVVSKSKAREVDFRPLLAKGAWASLTEGNEGDAYAVQKVAGVYTNVTLNGGETHTQMKYFYCKKANGANQSYGITVHMPDGREVVYTVNVLFVD